MEKKRLNKHEGYILLFRRFLENELWTEKRKFSRAEAWIDLLFMARYGKEPEEIIDRGEVIKIDFGEILTSVKSLSKKWGRSETWVRALLEHLESKSSIKKHTKKNRRTIIKIDKLSYFQNLIKKRSTEKLTEEAQKEHRKSHKNKDNKERKRNTIIGLDKPTKKKRRKIVFKKEFYNQVLTEYQRLKEMTLQGNEFLPIQQTIKTMFMAGRTPEQIISVMRYISEQDYTDWTIRTVKMKLPEILPKIGYYKEPTKEELDNDPLLKKMIEIHGEGVR